MQRWMGAVTALAVMAGCVQEPTTVRVIPTAAEQACMAAVARAENSTDVAVLTSQAAETGTQVTIGVGPDRAQWGCLVASNGATSNVMSLTNEGTL